MLSKSRVLLAASCLAVLALSLARCGGSSTPTTPTSPMSPTSAVVAGTVNRASGGAAAGLTVSVVGASASAAVQGSGAFELSGVPAGSVQLRFKDATVDATAQLRDVAEQERIQIQVNVSTSTATIVAEERSTTAKVELCHAEGNGSYHLIEVSVSAESAHRAHGDAKVGEPVPADREKTFNQDCRPTAASIASIRIKKFTNGQDADEAPGPTIAVGAPVSWEYIVTNTGNVALTGVVVTDDRGVRVICAATAILAAGQSMTCSGSGTATAGQYVNVGTAAADWAGGRVTSTDRSHYFGQAPSASIASIRIKKFTNGQDADEAPGPTIAVGAPVSWEYVVTNTGNVALTGVVVTDDRGVRVICAATAILAAGQSMTCSGSGTATAGQYVNVGTAAADWSGGRVTSTDRSHYFGQAPPSQQEGPKVELCHRTGNGSYHLIEVSTSAEPAHRGHGDGKIGEAVPGSAGKVFAAGCAVR